MCIVRACQFYLHEKQTLCDDRSHETCIGCVHPTMFDVKIFGSESEIASLDDDCTVEEASKCKLHILECYLLM